MGNCCTGNNHSAVEEEVFPNVDSYDGEKKNGKRHGYGTYHYPNGDIYEGEWRKSKKYGRGVYTYANGERLDGYFYGDKYIGETPNKKIKKRMSKKKKQNSDASLDDQRDTRIGIQSRSSPGQAERNRRIHDENSSSSAESYPTSKEVEEERRQDKELREAIRRKYNLPV